MDLNHGLSLLILVLYLVYTFTGEVEENQKMLRLVFTPVLAAFLMICLIHAEPTPVPTVYWVLLGICGAITAVGAAFTVFVMAMANGFRNH